jgi:hypothetical protein
MSTVTNDNKPKESSMLINTGAFIRTQAQPLHANVFVWNPAGVVAGAAGGSVLFGLAATGGTLGVTTNLLGTGLLGVSARTASPGLLGGTLHAVIGR